MNVIQRLVDALRHPGEYPEQRRHRRKLLTLDRRGEPQYRSTVYPTTKSTALADAERERRLKLVERGVTLGERDDGHVGPLNTPPDFLRDSDNAITDGWREI